MNKTLSPKQFEAFSKAIDDLSFLRMKGKRVGHNPNLEGGSDWTEIYEVESEDGNVYIEVSMFYNSYEGGNSIEGIRIVEPITQTVKIYE